MSDRQPLYEGKAKIIYPGPDAGTLVQYFKDDATAFNAQKKDVITGKGVLNNFISEHIMNRLADAGVTAARTIRASPVRFSVSTGLRLCGIADEPFWPAEKNSSASRSSVR